MIPLFKPLIAPWAELSISQTLQSGMIGEGPKVKEFTKNLSDLFKHPNITCLNSCTSAMELAVHLISKRSEINAVTPSFTFPATNTAVLSADSNSKILEMIPPDKSTMCIDLSILSKKIEENDKINTVIITLVAGLVPNGFDTILELCNQRGVSVVIDAAHAMYTWYKGKHISHHGDFVCFSLQSIKHLTTGDGGVIVCNRKQDHELAQQLKWFGIDRKVPEGMTRLQHQMSSVITDRGFKYHMNDISASLGLDNFTLAIHSAQWSLDNAMYYQSVFKDHPEINTLKHDEDCVPSWWVYGFTLDKPSRNIKMINYLESQGIASSPLWKSNDLHPAFKVEHLPDNAHIENYALFIPNGHWVTKHQREFIANKVIESLGATSG